MWTYLGQRNKPLAALAIAHPDVDEFRQAQVVVALRIIAEIDAREANAGWLLAIVDHWQTLIAGGLALLVAGVTTVVLVCQIRQTAHHADDQRQRRARAVLTVLRLALSELQQYARACISGLYGSMAMFSP